MSLNVNDKLCKTIVLSCSFKSIYLKSDKHMEIYQFTKATYFLNYFKNVK